MRAHVGSNYTSLRCSINFFIQANDGIRDWSVTGVQTCALPISPDEVRFTPGRRWLSPATHASYPVQWTLDTPLGRHEIRARSEERRVGKGGRCRRSRGDQE